MRVWWIEVLSCNNVCQRAVLMAEGDGNTNTELGTLTAIAQLLQDIDKTVFAMAC